MEITAKEAWEAVERLRLDISLNRKSNSWCASRFEPNDYDNRLHLGWGDTPVEAVAQLLERIGEAANVRAEVANAS